MASNPYEDAVDSAFVEKSNNPYEGAVDAMVDRDKSQVQASVFVASEGPDPDRQAKVLALSKRTNLPVSIVESEFDTLNKKYQMDPSDVDHVVKNLPATADWLKNPENATLGKDDLKAISKIEETVKDHTTFNDTFEKFAKEAGPFQAMFARAAKSAFDTAADAIPDVGSALEVGAINVNKSLAQLPGAAYAAGAYPVNLAYRLAGSDQRISVPEWIRQSDVVQYYERAAAEVAPPELNEGITSAIMAGDYKKAGKSLALQVIANAPNQALLIAAGMANPAAGGAFALSTTTAGAVYENQENNIDPVVGVPTAFAKGTIEAGFESLGTLSILHKWENQIAKTWGNGTAREISRDMAKTLASAFVGEGMEEGATNLAQDLLDKGTGVNPNALEGTLARAADAALVGGFSGIANTAPTAITAGIVRAQQTRQAERAKQFYTDLGTAVTETKLHGRSPERQQELIQKVVGSSPVENIYMNQSAFDTYFQSKDINPVAMATELGIAKEYEQAKQAGTDLQIPTATFAQKIAATEHYQGLANDVKFSPDSMSINEAKQDATAARVQLKDADQAASAEATGPTEVQQADSQKKVRQTILDQLVSAGYSKSEARVNADTFGDAIATLAKNSGQTAEEVVQSFPFNISEADVQTTAAADAAQNQSAIATLFQKVKSALGVSQETTTTETQSQTEDNVLAQEDPGQTRRGQIAFASEPKLTTVAKSGNGKFGVYEIRKSTQNPPLIAEFSSEEVAKRYSQQLRDIGNTNSLVSLINVFQAKDRSTFMHESAHYLFEVMGSLAQNEKATDRLKSDYKTLLDYVGVNSKEDITTSHHEKIAEAWETYLMEGKAPSEKLRKAFASFKVWLTSIYKGIPRQELTDAVRGVFDRMLVADQQVSQAELEMNRSPLFKDARAVGMSPEKAQKYVDALASAKQHSEETLRAKLMDDLLKVQRREYRERASSIEARVTDELNQEPAYKAKAFLEEGTLANGSPLPEGVQAFKLNRGQIKNVYGGVEGVANKAMHADGIDVQMAAEMLGYQTADELVRDLKAAMPKEQAIAEAIKHEMSELYPDLMGTPQVSDEAVKAIHNKDRRTVLRMELEHLAKSNMGVLKEAIRRVGMRVPSDQQVRAQAADIVGSKTIEDIRPYLFQRAEVKAAKEAGELLAKGDIQGAFDAKRRELSNHELFLAANEAQDRIKKDIKNLRNIFKSNEEIAKTRDMDIVGAGRAILAAYGIGKTDGSALDYLAKMKSYDPETYNTITNLINSVVTEAKDYRSISYNQFADMSDVVQAMWTFAKESRQQTIEGKKVERAQVVAELNTRIDQMAGDKEVPGYQKAVTDKEKRGMGMLGMQARLRKIEHWAYTMDKGELNGAFTKYIFRPISEAQTRYELARAELRKNIGEIAKNLTSDNASVLHASEIDYTFQGKQELLAALLHTGNESNLRKLLLGRKWGTVNADGSLNTDNWNAMIARFQQDGVLTKADYDFVQSVWDLNENLKPGAQKAHKQMYGYYFNEITSKEFETPFGTYRGGYMPAVVDPHIENKSQLNADKEALEKLGNTYMFPTTGRGFTKSRTEYNGPLLLDLQRIPGQMEKVLRFTYLEPTVKEVARTVNDSDFKSNISRIDPTIVSEALIPWLQRSALQSTSVPSQGKGGAMFDKVVNTLRSRTSMQFMAMNIPNMVQNLTGLFPALTRIDAQHVMGAFADYSKGPGALAEQIQEKSDYMKVRMGDNARELSKRYEEMILQPTAYDKVGEAAHKFAYFPEKLTNGVVEVVVWNGAYRQHLSQGHSETEAVKFADATIRQVQTDASPSGSSAIESGTAFQRLFTMFSMYFNNQANLLKSELSIAKEMGFTSKDGSVRAAKAVSFALLAPAIASAIIAKVFSGRGLDADDDGHYLDDALDTFIGAPVRYMFAMVPGGTIANSFVNSLNDKPFDDKINISPVTNSLEQAGKVAKLGYDTVAKNVFGAKTPDHKPTQIINDVLGTVGLVTGLPAPVVAKPASYLVGVADREYKVKGSNPVAKTADFTRGLLTGKGGN